MCEEWETEALRFSKAGRTVCVRNGVVLSKKGGLLAKLAPLFNVGGGGNIGSGKQGLSWISVDDAVSGIEFALNSSKLSGPVNLCAPTPASNAEFTSALGRYVRAYTHTHTHTHHHSSHFSTILHLTSLVPIYSFL